MHLTKQNMDLIESKEKDLEIRLCDEKRQKMRVGDQIAFEELDNQDRKILVTISNLIVKPSFTELFSEIDLTRAGWEKGANIKKACEDVARYYSSDEEAKWGVVAIEFKIE